MATRILVVDDEAAHAETTAEVLARAGHEVTVAVSGAAGLRQVRTARFDLIITDLLMKDHDGMEVLLAARRAQPEAEVIVITAHATVEKAVAAMQQGAYSFVRKPLNRDELCAEVARALERAQLMRENRELRAFAREKFGFEGIVGTTAVMQHVFETVRAVAPTNATVLISGENGTGKELVAKAIHHASPRAKRTFKAVNCATLSGDTLRSELFGYVRGAFTGADRDHEGVFEYADGGTLFLDEIGDMPLETQATLLRVLEERAVVRLGNHTPVPVDVRVIAATNRDLNEGRATAGFREDLFFRLNQVPVHLPPLRERRADIPLLAQRFLTEFAKEYDKPVEGFTPDTLTMLCERRWEGNVRELRNFVQSLVIFATGRELGAYDLLRHRQRIGELAADELPPELAAVDREAAASARQLAAADGPVGLAGLVCVPLKQVEETLIRNTLRHFAGNREQTAAALGIAERTLYRRLREYGIS